MTGRDFVAEAVARSKGAREVILSSVPPEKRLAALDDAVANGTIAADSEDAQIIKDSVSEAAATPGVLSPGEQALLCKVLEINVNGLPTDVMPAVARTTGASYSGPTPPSLPAVPKLGPARPFPFWSAWWFQPLPGRIRFISKASVVIAVTLAGTWAIRNGAPVVVHFALSTYVDKAYPRDTRFITTSTARIWRSPEDATSLYQVGVPIGSSQWTSAGTRDGAIAVKIKCEPQGWPPASDGQCYGWFALGDIK